MLRPAIFLDRDGVINKSTVLNGKPFAPRTMEEFEILPEIPELLRTLKDKGYTLVVVTNQPDVGNGLVDIQLIDAMHNILYNRLPIDKVKVCYHSQKEGCDCRKPKPGMFLQAAEELQIDLNKSVMIGDRASDVQAGKSVGCRTIFIDYQYNEPKPIESDFIVGSVSEIMGLFERSSTKGY